MSKLPKIAIITGSTRPGRFAIQPATWATELAKQRNDASVELLDLEQYPLPFLDEPNSPMQQNYQHEHTKAWSKKIDSMDGFIFVTPEYNHSISAVLKNAVDYLYTEWTYKSVAFISYGSQAGGTRSVEHWRGIAGELRMYDLREQVMFSNYWNGLDGEGRYQFTDDDARHLQSLLDAVIFWARELKTARQKLT